MTEMFTREAHAEWLQKRGAEEVGVPGQACECPIARWIRADFDDIGWPAVRLTPSEVRISWSSDFPANRAERRSWLWRYVSRIDDEPPMPISGTRALEILEKLDEPTSWKRFEETLAERKAADAEWLAMPK